MRLVAGQIRLERVLEPSLRARTALRAEYATLYRELLEAVREGEVLAGACNATEAKC